LPVENQPFRNIVSTSCYTTSYLQKKVRVVGGFPKNVTVVSIIRMIKGFFRLRIFNSTGFWVLENLTSIFMGGLI